MSISVNLNRTYKSWSLSDKLTDKIFKIVAHDHSHELKSLKLVCKHWRARAEKFTDAIACIQLTERLPVNFPDVKFVRLDLYPRHQLQLSDQVILQGFRLLQSAEIVGLDVAEEENALILRRLAERIGMIFKLHITGVTYNFDTFHEFFPKEALVSLIMDLKWNLGCSWRAFSRLEKLELTYDRHYLGIGQFPSPSEMHFERHWQEFAQLPLRHLKLGLSNRWSNSHKDPIGDLAGLIYLTYLELRNMKSFEPQKLVGLEFLNKLRALRLVSCSFGNSTTEKISRLPQLRTLGIINCPNVTSSGLSALLQLSALTRLELSPYINDGVSDSRSLRSNQALTRDQVTSELIDRLIATFNPSSRSSALTNEKFYIHLDQSEIDDGNLRQLLGIKNLCGLSLNFCSELTDRGIDLIGEMTDLRELSLVGNRQLPPGFLTFCSSLSQLTKLDASHTLAGAEDVVAIRRCEKLCDLALANCGNIPSSLSGQLELFKLEYKVLAENLSNLSNLFKENFDVLSQKCINLIQKIARASNYQCEFPMMDLIAIRVHLWQLLRQAGMDPLQTLRDLSSNERCSLVEGTLGRLSTLSHLTRLDLSRYHLQDFYSGNLNKIGSNDLQNVDLEQLCRLPKLRSFKMIHCPAVWGSGLAWIADLPQLENLNLSSCKNIPETDFTILQFMDKLTKLNVSHTRFGDAGYESIIKLTRLRNLNWECTDVSGNATMNNPNLSYLDPAY